MDALKMIAADSIKENRPQFEIGDTVRVHVNIREAVSYTHLTLPTKA